MSALPALAAEPVGPDRPSAAKSPAMVHFSAQGDEFNLPAPMGLCPPSAAYQDKIQQMSALLEKTRMVLGAALFPCEPTSISSRTPIALVVGMANLPEKVPGSRGAFVRQASNLLRTQTGQLQMQSGLEQVAALEKNATGDVTKISAKPTVVDEDEYAVYVFSNVQVTTGVVQKAGIAMEGLTIAKGRVILIVFIARPGSIDDAKSLLALAKLETKRFIDANEDLQG